MIMRSLIFNLFVIALLVNTKASAVETDDTTFIDVFLQSHCVRCHNEQKSEGELNLDDMAIDVAANRANFAEILERLRAADMPPEKEPRPQPADIDLAIDKDATTGPLAEILAS